MHNAQKEIAKVYIVKNMTKLKNVLDSPVWIVYTILWWFTEMGADVPDLNVFEEEDKWKNTELQNGTAKVGSIPRSQGIKNKEEFIHGCS